MSKCKEREREGGGDGFLKISPPFRTSAKFLGLAAVNRYVAPLAVCLAVIAVRHSPCRAVAVGICRVLFLLLPFLSRAR